MTEPDAPLENPEQDHATDEWIKAELRARGLDPDSLSIEQMVDLMQEAIQAIVTNLQTAADQAGDISARPEIDALLEQAEELKGDLAKLHEELDDAEAGDEGAEKKE